MSAPDFDTLMAYADGELDPIAAKRVERALATDPALMAEVARQRALREWLSRGFGAVAADPVPATLTGTLALNVVSLQRPAPTRRRWMPAAAVAATLVLAVGIGRPWQEVPVAQPAARSELVALLDDELSGGTGPRRVLASFRGPKGVYCRVYASDGTDGIACRDGAGWTIRRTQAATPGADHAYAQAAASATALMAAAQAMMAGDPLDPAQEQAARARGWR